MLDLSEALTLGNMEVDNLKAIQENTETRPGGYEANDTTSGLLWCNELRRTACSCCSNTRT